MKEGSKQSFRSMKIMYKDTHETGLLIDKTIQLNVEENRRAFLAI